jgi:hypothetical protein
VKPTQTKKPFELKWWVMLPKNKWKNNCKIHGRRKAVVFLENSFSLLSYYWHKVENVCPKFAFKRETQKQTWWNSGRRSRTRGFQALGT